MLTSEKEPTVLCVSGDSEQMELLEEQLRRAGYRVVKASDGLEAAERECAMLREADRRVAGEHERLLEQEREAGQLRQLQEMRAVCEFAASVAHDFNNILLTINGYSELSLRRLKKGDPLRRNVEEIKKAGERAVELTRQLLTRTREQLAQPISLSAADAPSGADETPRRFKGEDTGLDEMFDADESAARAAD